MGGSCFIKKIGGNKIKGMFIYYIQFIRFIHLYENNLKLLLKHILIS